MRVAPELWRQWLEHYVGHCRAELSTSQLDDLADALARGIDDSGGPTLLAPAPTAECGRRLVGFLASVEEPHLREALTRDAAVRLRWGRDR
jgi:hypothetical protein